MIRLFMTVGVLVGAMVVAQNASAERGDGDHRVGRIAGVVVAGDGVVPGAQIVLRSERTDRKMRTRSNDEGRFGFRHVPPGRYVVAGRHERAGKGHARVGVRAGHTSHVRLELRRRR